MPVSPLYSAYIQYCMWNVFGCSTVYRRLSLKKNESRLMQEMNVHTLYPKTVKHRKASSYRMRGLHIDILVWDGLGHISILNTNQYSGFTVNLALQFGPIIDGECKASRGRRKNWTSLSSAGEWITSKVKNELCYQLASGRRHMSEEQNDLAHQQVNGKRHTRDELHKLQDPCHGKFPNIYTLIWVPLLSQLAFEPKNTKQQR